MHTLAVRLNAPFAGPELDYHQLVNVSYRGHKQIGEDAAVFPGEINSPQLSVAQGYGVILKLPTLLVP